MDIFQTVLSYVLNPLFLISIIFWIVAYTLIKVLGKRGKDAVVFFFPFIAMFKTKKLNRLFQKISRKGKRFWKVFWNIGVVGSFIFMALALYFFISNFVTLLVNPKPENAIVPLIPGVTIGIPIFMYFILPILFVLTVHEFSHAIAAESDSCDVKSSGVFGAGIFFVIAFGAFVELDEFQLYSKKFSSGTRMRVAAAGVWSNIICAGLIFALLFYFPTIMKVGYDAEVFRVNTVLTNVQGGFNEGNLEPGDVVIRINETKVDTNNQAALDDFLQNKTALKPTPGDQLIFTCFDMKTRMEYTRAGVVGFKYYVGFDFERYENNGFKVTQVEEALTGGNNEGIIPKDTIIVQFGNTAIDYANDITFEQFLTQQVPDYKVNLTSNEGKVYEINVNYAPKVGGAHVFHDVFLGINYQQVDEKTVEITYVYNADTEGGNNQGKIEKGVKIDRVNGFLLDLSSLSFKDFVKAHINPQPGEKITLTDTDGTNYELNCDEIPILPSFLGITSESFWLPSNWLGFLLGGRFPTYLYIELVFSWLISFSIALFNLLPVSVFDGGRLMKEVIHLGMGTNMYDPKARKKLHYGFDPEENKQHLQTQNIKQIISVKEMIPIENPTDQANFTADPENLDDSGQYQVRPLQFTPLDTANTGYLDTVEIIDAQRPMKNTLIEVEVEYEQDLKEKPKKKLMSTISWSVGLMLLASFIISIAKFGTTFFWL
jgi:membrane-associated protease RseP (regulator of RpoE activity)